MMSWLAKRPMLLTLAVILGAATLTAFPLLLIPTTMAAAAWWGTQWYDRQRLNNLRRRQLLAWRADTQHTLTMRGDPRGTYGGYPPAC